MLFEENVDLMVIKENLLNKQAKLTLLNSQQGDVDTTYADITHAKQTYNYTPNYPIEKGLEAFIHWFKSQKT